jgi:hypothetical protein
MARSGDDGFGDEAFDEARKELETHAVALRDLVMRYIQEHDLSDELVSDLLIDIAIDLRKLAYVFGTEQPSAGGLKLELDRCRGEVEEALREHKKEAAAFIQALEDALNEEEDAEPAPPGPGFKDA